MKGQYLCDDKDGYAICIGDTVIDENGNEYLIQWSRHRELYGCGHVYGYFVPDFCSVITPPNKEI